jgi:hypothetical protein
MRGAFLLIVLAGCPLTAGPSTGECETDSDCSGNVCARDGLCYPSNEVREVTTTWTIMGRAANPVTCGPVEDLQISFSGGIAGAPLSYAPVPCTNGRWLMDKLRWTSCRASTAWSSSASTTDSSKPSPSGPPAKSSSTCAISQRN